MSVSVHLLGHIDATYFSLEKLDCNLGIIVTASKVKLEKKAQVNDQMDGDFNSDVEAITINKTQSKHPQVLPVLSPRSF
jgi:hypothetical protein